MAGVDPIAERELALDVLKRLRQGGFDALWAGGCVRDRLLGRLPKDYDVATSARPDQIVTLFGKRRTLEIGAAFGVVVVRGQKKGTGQVEVTTFRQDAEYSDGRHPDKVSFSTPQEDAQRRDFTINGLFYDPLTDQVIDFVGGIADLERRVVRAIGDPRARFREDKLRMLRAVRIATVFGFELDPQTMTAIQEMADEINVVSAERISQELRKMLVHPELRRGVELLAESLLLEPVLPELLPLRGLPGHNPRFPDRDAWTQTLAVLENFVDPSFPLAMAGLLHLAARLAGPGKSEPASLVEGLCRRWRLSNKEEERIAWLVVHQDRLRRAPEQPWPILQRLLICDGICDLIALEEARVASGDGDLVDGAYCRDRLALSPDELDPPPLLTGDDLIAHGVPRGKLYRPLLDKVRDAQLEEEVRTREAALRLVDWLMREWNSTGTGP